MNDAQKRDMRHEVRAEKRSGTLYLLIEFLPRPVVKPPLPESKQKIANKKC